MQPLPSLHALRAFDAAARLGSFRAAAEHLAVSPTAISHHIRQLEAHLGGAVFERSGRSVVLTETGRMLAGSTLLAFETLERAVTDIAALSGKGRVRIAAGPLFAARWLMPRLSAFWEDHPRIELEVVPVRQSLRDAAVDSDIVVHWDRLDRAEDGAVRLLELQPVAVASPGYLARLGPPRTPAGLAQRVLLHQRDTSGWTQWFQAMGIALDRPLRGPVFEDANVVLRGALDGQGVSLGWLPLIAPELAEGRLCRLFAENLTPTHAYFMMAARQPSRQKPVETVRRWLQAASNAG